MMSTLGEFGQVLQMRLVKLIALVGQFALMSFVILLSKGYLRDPDIWWHMKVGDWIVQHHAVPFVGILSRTAVSKPWIAYSWGFEVIVSRIYAWFGLLGFAYFGIVLSVLLSVVLFAACYTLSRRFWLSWWLTLVGTFAFAFAVYPRPVFFSIMLFTAMLKMLLQAQRSGRIQPLYWLPLLFMVWANLHIQFIYGLATFGLFIVVRIAMRVGASYGFPEPVQLPLERLLVILAACFAACCIGPYSYRLFVVVVQYSRATLTYSVIEELQSPSFLSFTHFVFLFVVMAAFYVVGRRPKIDPFQLALLIVATLCAFRTVRDAWFAAIPALLFMADAPEESAQDAHLRPFEWLAVAAGTALFTFLLGANMGFTERGIDYSVSHDFPVDASNFIRQIQPPGPLYNNFDWGGFLTWYLPNYPVVVDGRNDLYGDEFVAHHLQFNSGDTTEGDPELDKSNLVLLSTKASLAKLLKQDSHYRLVYEDDLADVFLRR